MEDMAGLRVLAKEDNTNGMWAALILLFALFGFGKKGFGGGDELGNGAALAANLANTNASVERGTSQIMNAQSTGEILSALAGTKDAIQNSNLATLGAISTVNAGIAGLGREICESNCSTQRVVEAGNARLTNEIFATNTNLGNKIDQSKWDLSSLINGTLNSLTLQNQNMRSEMDKGFCATNNNVTMSKCEVLAAVKADGDATRSLINANTTQDLRDRLALAQTALLEERESHRATKTQVNIGSTVTTGIGNTQNAITDSIVTVFDRRFDRLENVIVNLANAISTSTSAASNVSINANNAGTIAATLGAALAPAIESAVTSALARFSTSSK